MVDHLTMRWWPRTFRWQMLVGLMALQTLSIVMFAGYLVRRQTTDVALRANIGLKFEATSVALQASEALLQNRPGWVGLSVKMMGDSPNVSQAKVTDPAGNIIFVSTGESDDSKLTPQELAQIPRITRNEAIVFQRPGRLWEAAAAIYTGPDLRGYAWVEYDNRWGREQINKIIHDIVVFGIIWVLASGALVLMLYRSISRPLAILHRGTQALMTDPDTGGRFPLPTGVQNEVGDLIQAFNSMVASIAEQRAGLNDTLSLLDSMLANAPIGLAFFDHECRFTRVNRVFADLTGVPPSRHLGRTVQELLPHPAAQQIERAVYQAFNEQEPSHSFELNGNSTKNGRPWTWIVSAYPVKTKPQQVRWAGIIVLDASDRKRSEEALRKAEKLAVTGRLAASIAHEINNPLEAITNILFLLKNYTSLQDPALNYVSMAEYEVRRISEITQQTLRFYRQPTMPARVKMSELVGSVLSLYQGRFNSLSMHIVRDYDPELDLFCYAGEIRQVLANMVGNSIDASSTGGRLIVRVRSSHSWKNPSQKGVRFSVADSGSGMNREARDRAFEAFYTTKENTGTGLGLWLSLEILNKHNGTIYLRSRPTSTSGKPSGTVFQFFLPDDPTLAVPADMQMNTTA
jgi:PAS domain S-box-containing protein